MYSVRVIIDGIEKRRRSAGLLHLVVGFYLIINGGIYYRILDYKSFLPVLPVMLAGLASLVYGVFRKRIDTGYRYNYWLRLVQVISFTGLGVMMIGVGRTMDQVSVFIFAFLCILLLFSERRIFQDTTLYLDESGIRIPGYYRDYLVKWEDLSEVVVREDFITIFHRQRKYLQYQVMQDLSILEVAKLNAFCKEQLELVSQPETTNS
jgi:hypothetical protein